MSDPTPAVLFVSFGGPEGPEDVMPFLENVVRGRPVPRERLLEVAEHYQHFGGKSPINEQNRRTIAGLEAELARRGEPLRVYWGNRNWHPLLEDTMRAMRDDGVKHALAFVTSAFSSYSGCRQYRENIDDARAKVEGAPTIEKLRVYFDHPGFIEPMIDRVRAARAELPEASRDSAPIFFTAHSIPCAMAERSRYVAQLEAASALVAKGAPHRLMFQSRSGPPTQPWLEPDILDALRAHREAGGAAVIIAPIGFVSDHVEVLYDLDHEARHLCDELGLAMGRAGTVGSDARFVTMIAELIEERTRGREPRRLASPDLVEGQCAPDCCLYPRRPT